MEMEVANKPSSKKLVVYYGGDFAYGEMTEDFKRNGYVNYQSITGPRVAGYFEDNDRHGKVNIDFDEACLFTGYYNKDLKNGFGQFKSETEGFQGNFVDGHLSGYGRYWTSQNFYEGFWSEGRMHGYGVEIMSNSDCYLGEYVRGKKEGLGFYLYAKGGYYYGFFKNSEKTEMGAQYNTNHKCYYLGEFKNDARDGRGMQM